MMRVIFRNISAFATFLLFCVFCMRIQALATVVPIPSDTDISVKIVEVATEIGENYVRYPQLENMESLDIQTVINNEIVNAADIVQRLITLSTLPQGGTGLQVTYTAYLQDSLFSVVISAKGMMENFRNGHQYTALAYDLQTGARLQLKDFFTDPDSAVAWMEAELLDHYADELSIYLEHADVTPLPADSYAFDDHGITFYYPYQQFALLSGFSGAVQFQFGELQEFLIRAEDSVPACLGAVLQQYTDVEIKEQIEAVVSQGTLPWLPVKLGDSLSDLITDYRLTRTPDQYPGGRYFQLEEPAFRQILILSDALTQSYDHSVVEGILAMRMNLYGIQTGITTRDRWHQVLGEPAPSVFLDASLSADYGLPAVTADYYTVANRQLVFYADENGVLYAVRLMK